MASLVKHAARPKDHYRICEEMLRQQRQKNQTAVLSAKQPLVLGESNVCFLSWATQTKLPPNEFTRLVLKARGPRRGALGLGAGPWSCGLALGIRRSNPCY